MNDTDKGQRGLALVLVLVVFGLGSLTIIPLLDFAQSSLRNPAASSGLDSTLVDQYIANAGVQYVRWQLENQAGFADSVITSTGYDVLLDPTIGVPVIVTRLPTSQILDPIPPPLFTATGGTHADWLSVLATVDPALTTTVPEGAIPGIATVDACVPNTFTYDIVLENLASATLKINKIQAALPTGFTYLNLWSTSGFTGGNVGLESGDQPLVQVVSGQEIIEWDFVAPKPGLGSGDIGVLTFSAGAAPLEGTHYIHVLADINRQDIGDTWSWNYDVLIPGAVQAVGSEFDVQASAGTETITARIGSSACGAGVIFWSSS